MVELKKLNETDVALYLTKAQLSILAASLRETFAYMHGDEFALRLGAPRDSVAEVVIELKDLMEVENIEF